MQADTEADVATLEAALDVLSLAHESHDAPIDETAKDSIQQAADRVRELLVSGLSALVEIASDEEDEGSGRHVASAADSLDGPLSSVGSGFQRHASKQARDV